MKRHMHTTPHSSARPRRGAAAAEFAIVAPVFFVLLFAGMEFATMNSIRNTANNAAYEAARKVVVPGADANSARVEARRILAVVGVRNFTVDVTPDTIDENTRDVTVRIAIPYTQNAVIVPWFSGDIVIRSEITLRTERYGGIENS